MRENNIKQAKVSKIRKLSPVWIIPILTALIGLWIVFHYVMTQGPAITLTTYNAEGIIGGKTAIKSRSVDVGMVESVNLSEDLTKVEIKARLNNNMDKLLNKDSVFWVVKPQIGSEGVSGLGTLLSGVYIELQPGKNSEEESDFELLDSPPIASPDAKGVRLILESKQSGMLSPGDPVLFRGMRVGTVESSNFDTESRIIRYHVFVMAPYDTLVTSNVRFWKDSGFSVDLSAQGVSFSMSSVQTLLSGGVTFDIPEGWPNGSAVKNDTTFKLFPDRNSIQDSLYTRHENFIVLFNESVRGLNVGAPVEFKGIRVGTVVEAPHYIDGMWNVSRDNFYIPVLIRIEIDRVQKQPEGETNIQSQLLDAQKHGLRAALKSGNLLTGALYVDFDFYDNAEPWVQPPLDFDYPVIASVSGGLSQLQQKLMFMLDKINNLPIELMLQEMTATLKESQSTIKNMNSVMASLDKLLANGSTQSLPKDLQRSLNELNKTMKGMQPGSPAYNKLVDDMKRLDNVLREIEPLVKTLNDKSNALVFESAGARDPQPKGAKK